MSLSAEAAHFEQSTYRKRVDRSASLSSDGKLNLVYQRMDLLCKISHEIVPSITRKRVTREESRRLYGAVRKKHMRSEMAVELTSSVLFQTTDNLQ